MSTELEYRARLTDGSWTDWVGCGRFIGTRGKSEDLTGFFARLSGQGEKRYCIEVVGLFRGQAAAVVVGGAGECVSSLMRTNRGQILEAAVPRGLEIFS